jgi:hypothetical protein
MKNGVWDWDGANLWMDTLESQASAKQPGSVSSGRKRRSLNMSPYINEDWDYKMFSVIAYENGVPTVYASRILSSQPISGDPELMLRHTALASFSDGREMPIFVGHSFPCSLSVSILNSAGEVVVRLASATATRPEGLEPSGSLFYWDGLDQDGNQLPPGVYTVVASTKVGGISYNCSTRFTLKG